MPIDELPEYLRHPWVGLRAQWVAGTYRPPPARRVEMPKPDGRKRLLSIPTVLDRLIGPSHCASYHRAMGTPLPSAELRLSPATLGPPGRAASAGGHPRRLPVGGGPRPGSV